MGLIRFINTVSWYTGMPFDHSVYELFYVELKAMCHNILRINRSFRRILGKNNRCVYVKMRLAYLSLFNTIPASKMA